MFSLQRSVKKSSVYVHRSERYKFIQPCNGTALATFIFMLVLQLAFRLLSQHGKAAWLEKDWELRVSTEAAVSHRIEEWGLTLQEAKAQPELQRRGEGI